MRPGLALILAASGAFAQRTPAAKPQHAARQVRPAAAYTVAETVRPGRGVMQLLEKNLDSRIAKFPAREPMDILGMTRGVYIDGFGAVFTTELSLVLTPGLSPFKQSFTKEEVARIHARKVAQLGNLKEVMRGMLLAAAGALDAMPAGQEVVVGVTLFYFSFEDTAGLPLQIVMRGERRKLLDPKSAAAAIHTEVF